MSRWLDTTGCATLSIAICDRCKMKRRYDDLRPDGNAPGLRVCAECCDVKDPYRLPPRQAEKLALRYPRPDVSVAEDHDSIITNPGGEPDAGSLGIAPETSQNPLDGNLDNLSP